MRSSCSRSSARRNALFDASRVASIRLATVLLACAAGIPAAYADSATVTIENMQFTPATLTVKRGDKVTWTNKDLVPHTATAGETFDSKDIEPGKSWSYVTKTAGQFKYVCTLHPSMTATLVVE